MESCINITQENYRTYCDMFRSEQEIIFHLFPDTYVALGIRSCVGKDTPNNRNKNEVVRHEAPVKSNSTFKQKRMSICETTSVIVENI